MRIEKDLTIRLPREIMTHLQAEKGENIEYELGKSGTVILYRKEKKRVYIQAFERFLIYVNGQEKSAEIRSRKVEEMIAFLCCQRGQYVSKKQVTQALWNDSTALAMDNFYKTFRKLSQLPQQGIPLFIDNEWGKIRLRLDNVDSDVFYFETWSRSALPEDWECAVRLYRGMLFYQDSFSWGQVEEGYYDCLYWENVEKLLRYYEQKKTMQKYCFGGKNYSLLKCSAFFLHGFFVADVKGGCPENHTTRKKY